MSTDAWGIDDGWLDTTGRQQSASTATIEAIRALMGDPGAGRAVRVVRPGSTPPAPVGSTLRLEDGTDVALGDTLPLDLPLGLHDLVGRDGERSGTVMVSPGRCHLPDDLRAWGVTAQVPTTRSSRSWGIGDLADMRGLAEWLLDIGGSVLALSPLHAPTPIAPIETSPYFPSSRRWRNPLLICVPEVPGADRAPLATLAAAARRLLDARVVDRDACWSLHQQALEAIWSSVDPAEQARVASWRAEQGSALEGWARFSALAEVHGADWRRWPSELHRPHGAAVERAGRGLDRRVTFHAWLQLLISDQLDALRNTGVSVVQDLAVGVDPGGADAWLWQDLLAGEFSIGAPPDDFAPEGQDWGLPPWVPWRLRDAGLHPLAELLRACLAPGGGLRIDHVMGLSRLFWIPRGGEPADGAYVRFRGRELLELVALESARAGAVIVGEDLGTVEPHFREALADTGILSTRLVWFEPSAPETWPTQALAMVTTHDLPTVAGVCTGTDRPPQVLENLERIVGPVRDRSSESVAVDVHLQLGRSPAAIALATLEDVVGVVERPNQPGTLRDERPNWSVALPVSVDQLPHEPGAERVTRALAEGRRDATRA